MLINWNTYGKDKREWTTEMKAYFLAWVEKGGNFFVFLDAGLDPIAMFEIHFCA